MPRRFALYLLTLTLGGCAVSGQSSDWLSDEVAGPEPTDYRFTVARALGAIIGQNQLQANAIEISHPRRVDTDNKGAAWSVCLRVMDPQSRLRPFNYYNAIIQRGQYIDSRGAVGIDQCERQNYSAFDWKVERQ
jgi:hypothetical protein